MAARKERTHHAGRSNRLAGVTVHSVCTGTGPIDFDTTSRVAMPGGMSNKLDKQVPISVEGSGNQDFQPKLSGHELRQPKSDMAETRRLNLELKEKKEATLRAASEQLPTTILMKAGAGEEVRGAAAARQKGHRAAPRWNPARWYQAAQWEQCPLQKEEGETWNHNESTQARSNLKGQDSLMRTCWRPEDVGTPRSETGDAERHPTKYDKEEYYPGRSLLDGQSVTPGNDYQIRPISLPDFANPPPPDADHVNRMKRMREVVKQRFAGRPGLMGVFRNCCLTKQGFAFPKDLQQVFDNIGIKVDEKECELLVKAVDKDKKGAVDFAEFADMILGAEVDVGGPSHQAQERHVRHVTKTLVSGLLANGQKLGRAFGDTDQDRPYHVSKAQFGSAIGSACNHVSKQAVDFLWASMFPDEHGADIAVRTIDYRDFMSQIAAFNHDNRAPTPICLQGRKRQYDLLQRTFPLTKGDPGEVDLSRPHQDKSDSMVVIADRLCPRPVALLSKPREAAMLTEPYVEDIRNKALRVEMSLPSQLSKKRMRELLKNREMIHQDDLVDALCKELDNPHTQEPVPKQTPLWATAGPEVLSFEAGGGAATLKAEPSPPAPRRRASSSGGRAAAASPGPSAGALKLVPADLHAYMATLRTNRDHEVSVEDFLETLYKPEVERRAIHRVNDGMNRALRGHRPGRERPADSEVPRHENHWQARYVMEQLGDCISLVESSNGGRLKASKMFKRLDMDGDGYVSLSDLKQACDKYKVPHSSADLHAFFSEIDKDDRGSVDIGEFTRNYTMQTGSLLDGMARPIRGAYHEGGVEYGGPVQDKLDQQEQELAARHASHGASQRRAASEPAPSERAASSSPGTGSVRSQMSRTGASIATPGSPAIYAHEAGLITGKARVSDIIRARCSAWKPDKSEIFTSPARTRYGMTVFPDTRHVTEPSVPLNASALPDSERFKTTNSMHSLFAVPDPRSPQLEDTMRRHARNEFRLERIRQRQREFTERSHAANEATREFDELKVARKALNQFNYERKCRMACA